MKLLVGRSDYRGRVERFDLDLLETPVGPQMPGVKTIQAMVGQRPGLCHALRLHPDVASTGLAHPDVARACDAAKILSARWIVLPTGPRFTPTRRHRDQLAALAQRLQESAGGVAWEPRGVWADKEAESWAQELGVTLVRDLTQSEPAPGPVIYTRILPLGLAARLGDSQLERLADRLQEVDEAFVVLEGAGAQMVRARLGAWFDEDTE